MERRFVNGFEQPRAGFACEKFTRRFSVPRRKFAHSTVVESLDTAGNRVQLIETIGTGFSVTTAFGYDWLDRLTSAGSNSYTFDGTDNRLTQVQPGNTNTYLNNLGDQVVSLTSTSPSSTTHFTHDFDGRMTSSSTSGALYVYGWSSFDNMAFVTLNGVLQEQDFYGNDGTRRMRTDGSQYYDQISEYQGGGVSSPQVSYIAGNRLLGLDRNGASGSPFFYIVDGLGSVRQVVNSSGTVTDSLTLDEYGVVTGYTGTSPNLHHGFIGSLGVWNETGSPAGAPVSALGLNLMGQRWYSASLGRFITRDPIGFDGGLNLYGYVRGNPTGYADPYGLDVSDDLMDIGIGVAEAVAGAVVFLGATAGLAAVGITIPVAVTFGLAGLGLAYSAYTIATTCDRHKRFQTIGSLVPFGAPLTYRGAIPFGEMSLAELISIRAIPRYWGGRLNVAAHGGFDPEALASFLADLNQFHVRLGYK